MANYNSYIARGKQRYAIARSATQNIDNGSGTTSDDVILANLDSDIRILNVQAVYVEATDTAGAASANFKLGTTAGGTDIVGSTALAAAKARGAHLGQIFQAGPCGGEWPAAGGAGLGIRDQGRM